MEQIIPIDLNSGSGLWQAIGKDKKGKDVLVGTYILNGFLKDILSGKCTLVEIKILLLIARMSFGFQRDETNHLSLKDFSTVTSCHTSHLSTAIKKLKKKGLIFRRAKNGNKHIYSINLFRYGLPMTHYRICTSRNEKSKEEYIWGNASYLFGNSEKTKDYVILYSKKSYKKDKKLYIKKDIQFDIQTDKKTEKESSALAGRVLSPTPQSKDNKAPLISKDNISHDDITVIYQVHKSGLITGLRVEGKKVLDEFRGKIRTLLSKKDYIAIEKTLFSFIENRKQSSIRILQVFENEFVAPYDKPGYVDKELMAIFEAYGGKRQTIDIEKQRYNLEQKKIGIW